jgi:hypothetical protein
MRWIRRWPTKVLSPILVMIRTTWAGPWGPFYQGQAALRQLRIQSAGLIECTTRRVWPHCGRLWGALQGSWSVSD